MESLIMKVLFYLTCMLTVEHSFMLFNNEYTYKSISKVLYSYHNTPGKTVILYIRKLKQRDQEVKPKATEGANVRGGIWIPAR